jgi:hypothetical protein
LLASASAWESSQQGKGAKHSGNAGR